MQAKTPHRHTHSQMCARVCTHKHVHVQVYPYTLLHVHTHGRAHMRIIIFIYTRTFCEAFHILLNSECAKLNSSSPPPPDASLILPKLSLAVKSITLI